MSAMNQQFVGHPMIEPRKTSDEFATLRESGGTLQSGDEDADLHIGMKTQTRYGACPASELHVVHEESDFYASIGCGHEPGEQKIPNRV